MNDRVVGGLPRRHLNPAVHALSHTAVSFLPLKRTLGFSIKLIAIEIAFKSLYRTAGKPSPVKTHLINKKGLTQFYTKLPKELTTEIL